MRAALGAPWRGLAVALSILLIVPLVHPDRIARRHGVHRQGAHRPGGAAWVRSLLPGSRQRVAPAGRGCPAPSATCPLAAAASAHFALRHARPLSPAMLAAGSHGADADESERSRFREWVIEKTRGAGNGFDMIFERSKNRIDQYLDLAGDAPVREQEKVREELSRAIQLSRARPTGQHGDSSKFDDIVERSKQRLDLYLGSGNVTAKAEVKQELAEALKMLKRDDFQIIAKRSSKRIDMEAQRWDLLSKRKELVHLQKTLRSNQQEVQAYRQSVEAHETALSSATSNGAARGRIQDLQDSLRASQLKLRNMEHSVKLVEEEATALLLGLQDTEAQLEALRIRNELVSERERQLYKLQNLLVAMSSSDSGHQADANVSESIAHRLDAMAAGMVTLAQQGTVHQVERLASVDGMHAYQGDDEQLHARLRDFLWQRVGLSKNKAAISAAAMHDRAEGVKIEALETTVSWLQKHLLVSSDKLAATVELCPAILLLDVEANLEPIWDFLTNTVKLDDRGVAAVVTAHPAILEADVKKELRPRLADVRKATGVSAENVAKLVQMHAGVLGKEGLQCLQAHIDFFSNDVGLSKPSMGRILGTLPGLTCMSIAMQLRPTHEWLLKIGVPPKRMERLLLAHPKTLSYSLEKNLKPTLTYLWEEIGVRDDKIGKMVSACPQIMGLSVEGNLRPTVAFFVEEVGVPAPNLAKIFSTFPQLFGLSLDKTIRPRVDFLVTEVGVPRDKLAKVICSFPNLLAYNHLDNLRPTVSYLHQDVGIPTDRMGKMVAAHPQILGYSIEDKLLPTVEYLVDEVKVPEESIHLVVERCPKLLGCSVERNLRPTVRFLMEEVGMSQEEVGQIVMRYPTLMGLSIDNNLRPKLNYLVDEVKIDRTVIRNQLKTCPQLLAYSLEQRIKPRHRLLHSKGLKLGLHSMLSPTDIAFYQRYGGGLSRVPRVKPDLPTGDNLKSPSSSASPVYYWHGSDSSAPGERSGTLTLKRASASAVRGMRKAVKSPAAPRKKAAPQPGRKSKAKTVSAPK